MEERFSLYLVRPGPRPPFSSVAHYLWGEIDFDSDGNSSHPDDNQWTELTLILRPTSNERIDIDPVSENPLVLVISSASVELARRAAQFLAVNSGGVICAEWPHA